MKYQELINLLEKNNLKLKYSKKREECILYEIDKSNFIISESIITEFDCDDENNIQENLIKSIQYHIDKINENDPDYFSGCDREYLKTTWKKLLKNILTLIKEEEKRLKNQFKNKQKTIKEFKIKKEKDYGLSL